MSRGVWIAIAGTVGFAAITGVAVGKDQPAPPRSDQGAANGRAVGQAPAPTPARGQPRAVGRTRRATPPVRGGSKGSGKRATGTGSGSSSGNGANVSGPYNPSGVGLPSGNGRSASNNGNRPCAGCVGKADAKNPLGQLPGGSDSNRGYECDENQGVGKTNPAHSGCRPTSTSLRPGTTPATAPPLISPGAIARVPALVPVANRIAGDQGASPEDNPGDTPVKASVQDVESVKASPGGTARELAFTGLGLAWMALLGAGFMAFGGALRRKAPLATAGGPEGPADR